MLYFFTVWPCYDWLCCCVNPKSLWLIENLCLTVNKAEVIVTETGQPQEESSIDSPLILTVGLQLVRLIEIQNQIFAHACSWNRICPQRGVFGGLMTYWTSVHGSIFTPIVQKSLPPAVEREISDGDKCPIYLRHLWAPRMGLLKGDPHSALREDIAALLSCKSDRKSDNDKDLLPVSGPEKKAHVIIR